MKKTPLGTIPTSLFKDGKGQGLEPGGGEFQPLFTIAYPGGGAHLIFILME
jgi:hypothetical protein